MDSMHALFRRAADVAADHRAAVGSRPVPAPATLTDLLAGLDTTLQDEPRDAGQVLDELVTGFGPGVTGNVGPRFFGYVIGGATPAATAADIVAVGWDQCAFNATLSPAAAAAEQVAGRWVTDVLGLPERASVGFVTGAQGANTAGLAAARHHVLARVGWNVERDGLLGAPAVRVVASAERHATIDRSLRLLGLGAACVQEVPAGPNGAI